MNIRRLLRIFLPVVGVILLILSVSNIMNGYNFSKKLTTLPAADVSLMGELKAIDYNFPLDSLDSNMVKLKELFKLLFSKIRIASDESVTASGIDKIGEFKDILITANGDFLQQIYFLQQIKKEMRNFVILNKIIGNNKEMIINARIYGNTIK